MNALQALAVQGQSPSLHDITLDELASDRIDIDVVAAGLLDEGVALSGSADEKLIMTVEAAYSVPARTRTEDPLDEQ